MVEAKRESQNEGKRESERASEREQESERERERGGEMERERECVWVSVCVREREIERSTRRHIVCCTASTMVLTHVPGETTGYDAHTRAERDKRL